MAIPPTFPDYIVDNIAGYPSIGGGGVVSPDAPQTTAFLARTSGLSGAQTAAYKALINGMVADGTFALLDALYIFATKDTTTANLNLISTSYGLTPGGVVTFTVNVGYQGNGTTGFLDTGYVPNTAGGHFALNLCSVGGYDLSAVGSNGALIGCANAGGSFSFIGPGPATLTYDLNDISFPAPAIATAAGAWIACRSGAATINLYKNGTVAPFASAASPSVVLPVFSFYICAINTTAPQTFSSDKIAAAFIGGFLSAAQAVAINNRINTYMTAFGINVY